VRDGIRQDAARGSTKHDLSHSAALGGQSKETGLVVAHSSSRPAQGVGGCLLPTPWPFGVNQHMPFSFMVCVDSADGGASDEVSVYTGVGVTNSLPTIVRRIYAPD
jgi:hypothetical protein